ncbi:MAG: hypothetical protein KKH98_05985 [Spirochaetes bacterium]|nr:hypothetical protein [Spirochaetota bacterium]
MKKYLILSLILVAFLFSCTQDVMSPTGSPTTLTISPDNPSVTKGGTKKFIALAYDRNGQLVDIDPVWTVEGGVGIIDALGHFYAPQGLEGPFPMLGKIVATYNHLRTRLPITIELGIYSIYSDIYPHNFIYDRDNPPNSHGGWLGIAGNTNFGALSDDNVDFPPTANKKSLKIKLMETGLNWMGGYWKYGVKDVSTANENFSQYANAYLHFYIKAKRDVHIKIESTGGNKLLQLNSYITPNETWQKVVIPLNDGAAIDFTEITVPVSFYVRIDEGWSPGEFIKVGEIMYSPSADWPE